MLSFLDKYRGHHIASTLSAGILPSLLLKPPGMPQCLIVLSLCVCVLRTYAHSYPHNSKLSCSNGCFRLFVTNCSLGLTIPYLAGQGGQDLGPLLDVVDDCQMIRRIQTTYISSKTQNRDFNST